MPIGIARIGGPDESIAIGVAAEGAVLVRQAIEILAEISGSGGIAGARTCW